MMPESPVPPPTGDLIRFPVADPPTLCVIVDTEEEFDWRTFSSQATQVSTIRHQGRAQRLFDRYGVVPTYAVDYPVASQPDGYLPLKELLADGRCEIGGQLHPWVNPPFEETVCEYNTFAGNLPFELERAKLARLTDMIVETFGCQPLVYRAGRYGAGRNTPVALAELGYTIDCSMLPRADLRRKHGPDYRRFSATPYWFGPNGRLLGLPVTADIIGPLHRIGRFLHPRLSGPAGTRMKLPAVCARLRLFDRITLTPEGVSLAEAKRLTRAMAAAGHRVFVISYHSPSLEPGHTPYVRTERDLARFLDWIEGYLAFFFGEMRGVPSTPPAVRRRALALTRPGRARAATGQAFPSGDAALDGKAPLVPASGPGRLRQIAQTNTQSCQSKGGPWRQR